MKWLFFACVTLLVANIVFIFIGNWWWVNALAAAVILPATAKSYNAWMDER